MPLIQHDLLYCFHSGQQSRWIAVIPTWPVRQDLKCITGCQCCFIQPPCFCLLFITAGLHYIICCIVGSDCFVFSIAIMWQTKERYWLQGSCGHPKSVAMSHGLYWVFVVRPEHKTMCDESQAPHCQTMLLSVPWWCQSFYDDNKHMQQSIRIY